MTDKSNSADPVAAPPHDGSHCPRCDSPAPHLHPAMQYEGEVQECQHEFHQRVTNQNPVAAPPVGAEPRAEDVLKALIEQFEMYLGDGVTESSQPRALRDAKDLLSRLRAAAPSLSREAFEAGWNAGFQEALTPDLHPERNRCEDAFQAVRAAGLSAASREPNVYDAEKPCCTICDRQKLCHVCGSQTLYACSDCHIDFGVSVYVCATPACRDAHEAKCSARLRGATR